MSSTGPTDQPQSSTIGTGYDPTEQRIEFLEERYRELQADYWELEREHHDLKWELERLKGDLMLFAIMAVGTVIVVGTALLAL